MTTNRAIVGRQSALPAPNIVFICIDDMGWRDLSCYGSTFYETPNVDRIASAGIRFTDAYAAAPVCSPTRASLLSGKYPARVGVTQYIGGHNVGRLCDVPYMHELPLSEYSIARALRDAGYQTWHVGKWHLGGGKTAPEHHGFDVNIGGGELGHPPSYFSPYRIPSLADGPDGEYLTDRLTTEAISLIEQSDERPFFLNLWHYAVHTPIQSPSELVTKYEAKACGLGLDRIDPITNGEPMPTWTHRHQPIRRRTIQSDPDYGAMIENLDTNIGCLMAALKRIGKFDNTVVIFTSDNGGLSTAEGSFTCNAPLSEGKGWMAEGGNRVPLIVEWPAVTTPGTISDAVITSPDFYPTLLQIAGVKPNPAQHLDGLSFVEDLCGKAKDRGPVFWHYPHYSNQGDSPSAAVREGTWKLIRYFEDNRFELYDLSRDISEEHDMTNDEPGVTTRLGALLESWLSDVSALIPKSNPHVPFDD